MSDPFDEFTDADPQTAEPELTVMEAIFWSMRKRAIQKERGCTFDEAEAIIRREMAERRQEAP
jgi:hypothetical protein